LDKKINLDNTKKERQKERKNERKYKDRKKERNKQIMLHQEVLYLCNLLEVSKKERVSVFLTFGGKGGKTVLQPVTISQVSGFNYKRT